MIFRVSYRWMPALLMLGLLASGATVKAADVGAPSPSLPIQSLFQPEPLAKRSYGFDVRLGGFAHAVGSAEANTFDASLQVVLPKFLADNYGWWNFLNPHTYVGGMFNTGGRTSSVRAGLLWQIPFTERFFGEIFFGGAYHDGSKAGDATHNALGSRALFNVGGSIGYRFTPQWSVLVTFDHLSNGKEVFGTGFDRNVGINNYGAQVSYAF